MTNLNSSVARLIHVLARLEPFFGCGQHVAIARDPHIQRRQQEDAHDEGCDETSDDNDGKGALRVGTNRV